VIQITCADTNSVTSGTYATARQQIVTFQPDVILALTAQETGDLVEPIEAALYANAGLTALPIWVLSTRNDEDLRVLSYLNSFSNGESAGNKLKRFLGVQWADPLDTSQVQAWMTRMQANFHGVVPSIYAGRGNFYDAIYWLAYGLYSAGVAAPTTGDSFAIGVRKLLSGPRIDEGNVAQGFTTISNNPSGTTFYGTLGQPNYPDPASGIPQGSGSVYCYNQIGNQIVANYDELVMYPDGGSLGWNPNVTPCFLF
jgi:hypothetical protein